MAKKVLVNEKPLNKKQLIQAIADSTFDGDKKMSESMLTELVDLALKEVKKNGSFVFPDLGKLVLLNRKARMGRNPATGETIKIKAKKVLKFRVSSKAKKAILG